jgi:cysteine desulfurase / selenocysteine lyase
MTSRREFLLKSGMGALGLIYPFSSATSSPTVALSNNEKDWNKVRKAFPLSKDICYLNNGTMGPSPEVVLQAIAKKTDQVNRLVNSPQKNTQAKKSLASFLGVSHSEIALTHNVTEGINIAVWAIPLKRGDQVILTDQEHVGNALPWLNRRRLEGIELKVFSPKPTAAEVLDQVAQLIGPNTKAIAIPHIPCTTGQVYPIKEICELAKSKNIITIIDGAHGPGMLDMDLRLMACDVYVSCCHKWLLGPKGTGFVYVKEDRINDFNAQFVGGHSDSGWQLDLKGQDIFGFKKDAHKFHFGTQNYANYYGINAAVDFHNTIGKQRIETRVKELNNHLLAKLQELEGAIQIITPLEAKSRAAILTFKIKNVESRGFVDKLRKRKLILRYLAESGHDAIRVSNHIYNSIEELDYFVDLIKQEIK